MIAAPGTRPARREQFRVLTRDQNRCPLLRQVRLYQLMLALT
jgi:hypothetical protein